MTTLKGNIGKRCLRTAIDLQCDDNTVMADMITTMCSLRVPGHNLLRLQSLPTIDILSRKNLSWGQQYATTAPVTAMVLDPVGRSLNDSKDITSVAYT